MFFHGAEKLCQPPLLEELLAQLHFLKHKKQFRQCMLDNTPVVYD